MITMQATEFLFLCAAGVSGWGLSLGLYVAYRDAMTHIRDMKHDYTMATRTSEQIQAEVLRRVRARKGGA